MTFIQGGIAYRTLTDVKEIVCVGLEVFYREGSIVIFNVYNPCDKISQELLEKVGGNTGKRVWRFQCT